MQLLGDGKIVGLLKDNEELPDAVAAYLPIRSDLLQAFIPLFALINHKEIFRGKK